MQVLVTKWRFYIRCGIEMSMVSQKEVPWPLSIKGGRGWYEQDYFCQLQEREASD